MINGGIWLEERDGEKLRFRLMGCFIFRGVEIYELFIIYGYKVKKFSGFTTPTFIL